MGKASGTTRASAPSAGAPKRSGYTAPETTVTNYEVESRTASLKTRYAQNIDTDIVYETPKGAVGALIGNTIDKELETLKTTLRGISDVEKVGQVYDFGSKVDRAFNLFESRLDDKISILEHNKTLAKGRSIRTYDSAISELYSAEYKIRQFKSEYGTRKLADLEGHLMKNNKW